MQIGEEIHLLGNWGILHFIENNGMALHGDGWKTREVHFKYLPYYSNIWNRLVLSSLINKKANLGLILGVSAIMAGAIGNIIDSAFYGLIFSESLINLP